MAESRTEQPTARALRKARSRGDVPRSVELTAGVVLLSAGLILEGEGAKASSTYEAIVKRSFGAFSSPPAELGSIVSEVGLRAGWLLLPIAAVCFAVAWAASFAQVGGLFVSPWAASDSSRSASFRTRIGSGLATLGVGTLVAITAAFFSVDALRGMFTFAAYEPRRMVPIAAGVLPAFLVRVGGVLALYGAAVLVLRRIRHRHAQKMTRSERRRDLRETEGDPLLRRERARRHRELAGTSIAETLRDATVVVVAPNEVAIVLRYDPARDPAPRVCARCGPETWSTLVALAESAGVPMRVHPPLARAFAFVSEGALVPSVLYDDVADLLAALSRERAA